MEKPKISISGNTMEIPRLEIPLIVNDKESKVIVRKLLAGERREILKKHLNTGLRGQQINAEIQDLLGLQIETLSKVIIEAPFEHTEAALSNLTEDVIDYLYQTYSEWANTDKKKMSD